MQQISFWVNGPAHTLRRLSCSLDNRSIEWAVSSGWFKTFIHTVEADVWNWTFTAYGIRSGMWRAERRMRPESTVLLHLFLLLIRAAAPTPPPTLLSRNRATFSPRIWPWPFQFGAKVGALGNQREKTISLRLASLRSACPGLIWSIT